jgi:hypothetical protein
MIRTTSFVLCAVALLFVSTGCGQPKAGDKCNTTGFLCADAANALECKAAVWVSLPCRGPAGCTRTTDLVKCDMTGNAAGDNCASTADTKGLCTSDGLGTLQCYNGTLVKTNTCRSCSVNGDTVVCNP